MQINQMPQGLPLDAFKEFKCPSVVRVTGQMPRACNGSEFRSLVRLKTYKGVMSNNQVVIMQIQVFECVACGSIHVPKE